MRRAGHSSRKAGSLSTSGCPTSGPASRPATSLMNKTPKRACSSRKAHETADQSHLFQVRNRSCHLEATDDVLIFAQAKRDGIAGRINAATQQRLLRAHLCPHLMVGRHHRQASYLCPQTGVPSGSQPAKGSYQAPDGGSLLDTQQPAADFSNWSYLKQCIRDFDVYYYARHKGCFLPRHRATFSP